MQELINLREAALALVLGRRNRDVLNLWPAEPEAAALAASDGQALAAAIKTAVNTFKAEAMDATGRTVNYEQLRTSPAYAAYQRLLTPQLQIFDPAQLTTRNERLAFWINLYNGLVLDAVVAYDVRESVARQWAGLGFFRRAAYLVGGQRCSLEDIEHGILRANQGNPFLPGPQFAPEDPRRAWVI